MNFDGWGSGKDLRREKAFSEYIIQKNIFSGKRKITQAATEKWKKWNNFQKY